MWTLFSYCKSRYSHDMRSAAESMPAETRQSLTDKIVRTLDEGDEEDGGENIEQMLDKIEMELGAANRQLEQREEKEAFLAVRIKKYKEMLKEQGEHLSELQKRIENADDASENDQQAAEQEHYQDQAQKQQSHREALGKVVDVHLDILKGIKICKRNVEALEQKKHDLEEVTNQCREFLVMAEEAEREQQHGVMARDDVDSDLQMMEVTPMLECEKEANESKAYLEPIPATDEDVETKTRCADDKKSSDSAPKKAEEVPLVEPVELTA